MPWHNPEGFVFDRIAIAMNAPDEPGVYGLSDGEQWICIDEADNLRETLFEHLDLRHRHSPGIAHRNPRRFTFELCPAGGCAGLRAALLAEYQR